MLTKHRSYKSRKRSKRARRGLTKKNIKNIKKYKKIKRLQHGGGKTVPELKNDFLELIKQNKEIKVPEKTSDKFRIASYNVHYFTDVYEKINTFEQVVNDINKINADVIVLQEILLGGKNIKINDTVTLDLSELFDKFRSIGYKKIINCNSVPSWFSGSYGNLMLVHESICDEQICTKIDESNYTFSKAQTSTTVSGAHEGTKETRCYIYAKISVNTKTYHIIGTHLDVASEDTRLKQIELIHSTYGHLANEDNILIIMGDFNTFNMDQYKGTDYETSPFTKDNGKVYKFLIGKDYFDITTTPPPVATNWNMTRVDFIFSSQILPGSTPFVMYTDASDHLPVVVDIPK